MLNQQQMAAVESKSDKKAIIAGAGTGKTHTITRMIAKDIERGHEPSNMVAITFTRNAAKELKERLNSLIGIKANEMSINTVHGFCLNILTEYINQLGWEEDFNIYDQDDREDILKAIIDDLNVSSIKNLLSVLSGDRSEDLFDSMVLNEYQERMKKYNAIDLDMILDLTIQLLGNENILTNIRKVHKYFYIDEFQDTNDKQLKLIKILNPDRLVVIGDPDQSIYEWNNAKPEYMVNIEQTFPNTELFKLEQNYRSTNQIIESANKLIRHNLNRIDKELVAQSDGDDIEYSSYDDELEEINYIYDNLDAKYSNNAIICRNNARAGLIADKLAVRKIPINLMSSSNDIFKKQEIRKFIKLLQVINNPDDDYALEQILNWQIRRIDKIELASSKTKAIQNSTSLFKTLNDANEHVLLLINRITQSNDKKRHMTAYGLVKDIMNIFSITTKYKTEDRQTRLLEFEELRKVIKRWEIVQGILNQGIYLEDFVRYIQLRDIQDKYNKKKEAVNIMTVHGSKGLEFKKVFLPGLNEKEFPNGRSENIEEERRLLYVGITRAEEELHITRANTRLVRNRFEQMTTKSRFIKECMT